MADPLSIAAGVAGLLGITIQLLDFGGKFVHDLKESSTAPQEFLNEVKSLSDVLAQLRDFLRHQETQPLPFSKTSVLYSTNIACEQKLRKVLLTLQKYGNCGKQQKKISKAIQRLKWPFAAKEHREVIEDLHRYVQVFMFGLTVEGCYLLSENSSQASEILKAQLTVLNEAKTLCWTIPELVSSAKQATKSVSCILTAISKLPNHSSEIAKISNGINKLESFADEQIQQQASREELEERQKVLNKLSTLSFHQKHNEVFERHQEGTCQWLLQDKIFLSWMERSSDSVLWAVGVPGSGKTVLTSIIVEHLQSTISNICLAYIYFDYKVSDEQTALNVILCLIRQLAERSPKIMAKVKEFSNKNVSGSRFTIVNAIRLLEEVSEAGEKIFLVIDALDECPESSETGTDVRNALLKIFSGLPSSVYRIVFTSRPNVNIEPFFKKFSKIKVEASQADLNNFIESRIAASLRLRAFTSKDNNLEAEIVEKISNKSNGMFLLAQLQLEQVASAMTARQVRKFLEALSEKLNGMYEDAIVRIQAQLPEQRALAMRVLSWVAYAKRPLYVDELIHGLSVEPGDTAIDESGFVDIDTIIASCAGLAQLEAETTKYDPKFRKNVDLEEQVTVRFVHYTVQEFILNSGKLTKEQCHWDIASASITYLSFPDFDKAYEDNNRLSRIRAYPFIDYAAHYWPGHVAHVKELLDKKLVMSLFTKYSSGATIIDTRVLISGNAAWKNWVNLAFNFHQKDSKLFLPASHSHLVSVILLGTFGAWNVVRLVLNEDKHGNALASSLATSQDSFTNRILSICGDKKSASRALFVAIWRNRKEYIDRLLKAGADVNYCENDQFPSKFYGSRHKDIDQCPTTLKMAIRHASVELIEKLVAAGADVNRDSSSSDKFSYERNSLIVAMERGDPAIIKLLLTAGANPNPPSKYNAKSPLIIAIEKELDDTCQQLIDAGADVNYRCFDKGTPLRQAVIKKNITIAKSLVKAGADSYRAVYPHGTSMSFCIEQGNLEMVQALIEAGANRDQALRIATRLKAPEAAAMLVKAGAKTVEEDSDKQSFYCGLCERHAEPDREAEAEARAEAVADSLADSISRVRMRVQAETTKEWE